MVIEVVRRFALIGILISCAQGATNGPENPGGGKFVFTGDRDKDWAQIIALEDQAKALVKTDGCTSADQCRTAAVGNRACGGPRYYLVYCSRTTDSAALFAKLKAVLRRLAPRTQPDLDQAISSAIDCVPPPEAIRFIRHCGFRLAAPA